MIRIGVIVWRLFVYVACDSVRVVAQWHKRVSVAMTVVGLIPTRRKLINFLVLVRRQGAALRSATQRSMLWKFGGK